MKEEVFYVDLIKRITKLLLDHTKSDSQALKIIKIGIQHALCEKRIEEKKPD